MVLFKNTDREIDMVSDKIKNIILDAAESLIIQNGFYATSIRQITAKAKTNIAAINYHFGSKEELMKAMISRRLIPVNEERLAYLDKVLKKAEKECRAPDHTEIVKAFFEPVMKRILQDRSFNKYFYEFIIWRDTAPNHPFRNHYISIINEVIDKFVNALSLAFPDSSQQENNRGFFFSIGVMAYGAILIRESQKAQSLVAEYYGEFDFDKTFDYILKYISSGLEIVRQ